MDGYTMPGIRLDEDALNVLAAHKGAMHRRGIKSPSYSDTIRDMAKMIEGAKNK